MKRPDRESSAMGWSRFGVNEHARRDLTAVGEVCHLRSDGGLLLAIGADQEELVDISRAAAGDRRLVDRIDGVQCRRWIILGCHP